MREKEIEFRQGEEVLLAKFVSQLVREGVTFDMDRNGDNYLVILTGGY